MVVSDSREGADVAVTIETYHEDGRWRVRREGETEVLSSHETKVEAVAAGRDVAIGEGAEHVIKTLDGRVESRNTYEPEPGTFPG